MERMIANLVRFFEKLSISLKWNVYKNHYFSSPFGPEGAYWFKIEVEPPKINPFEKMITDSLDPSATLYRIFLCYKNDPEKKKELGAYEILHDAKYRAQEIYNHLIKGWKK